MGVYDYDVPDFLNVDASDALKSILKEPVAPYTPPPDPVAEEGEFVKGVKRGMEGLKSAGYGAAGLIGSGLGIDALRDWGYKGFLEHEEEATKHAGRVQNIEDIKSIGDVGDWAAGTFGSLVPSIGEAAVTSAAGAIAGSAIGPEGTIGGAAAGAVGKQAVKSMIRKLAREKVKEGVERQAAKAMAKEMVESLPAKALYRNLGTKAGIVAGTAPIEAGGMWGEGMQEGKDNPYSAAVFGTLSGLSELLGGEAELIDLFTNPARQAMKGNILKRIGVELGKTIPQEAGQEATQEILSIINRKVVDPTYDMFGEDARSRVLNSAAAGAIGGVAFGGVGGVMSGRSEERGTRNEENLEPRTSNLEPGSIEVDPWKATEEPPHPVTAAEAEEQPVMPEAPKGPLTRAIETGAGTVVPAIGDMAAPAGNIGTVPSIGETIPSITPTQTTDELVLDEARDWAKQQIAAGKTQLMRQVAEHPNAYYKRLIGEYQKSKTASVPDSGPKYADVQLVNPETGKSEVVKPEEVADRLSKGWRSPENIPPASSPQSPAPDVENNILSTVTEADRDMLRMAQLRADYWERGSVDNGRSNKTQLFPWLNTWGKTTPAEVGKAIGNFLEGKKLGDVQQRLVEAALEYERENPVPFAEEQKSTTEASHDEKTQEEVALSDGVRSKAQVYAQKEGIDLQGWTDADISAFVKKYDAWRFAERQKEHLSQKLRTTKDPKARERLQKTLEQVRQRQEKLIPKGAAHGQETGMAGEAGTERAGEKKTTETVQTVQELDGQPGAGMPVVQSSDEIAKGGMQRDLSEVQEEELGKEEEVSAVRGETVETKLNEQRKAKLAEARRKHILRKLAEAKEPKERERLQKALARLEAERDSKQGKTEEKAEVVSTNETLSSGDAEVIKQHPKVEDIKPRENVSIDIPSGEKKQREALEAAKKNLVRSIARRNDLMARGSDAVSNYDKMMGYDLAFNLNLNANHISYEKAQISALESALGGKPASQNYPGTASEGEVIPKPESEKAKKKGKKGKSLVIATPEQEEERRRLYQEIYNAERGLKAGTADRRKESARIIKAAEKAMAKLPPGMLTREGALSPFKGSVAESPLVKTWLEGVDQSLEGAESPEAAYQEFTQFRDNPEITLDYFKHLFAQRNKPATTPTTEEGRPAGAAPPTSGEEQKASNRERFKEAQRRHIRKKLAEARAPRERQRLQKLLEKLEARKERSQGEVSPENETDPMRRIRAMELAAKAALAGLKHDLDLSVLAAAGGSVAIMLDNEWELSGHNALLGEERYDEREARANYRSNMAEAEKTYHAAVELRNMVDAHQEMALAETEKRGVKDRARVIELDKAWNDARTRMMEASERFKSRYGEKAAKDLRQVAVANFKTAPQEFTETKQSSAQLSFDELAADTSAAEQKLESKSKFIELRRKHIRRKLAEAKEPRERERLQKALARLQEGQATEGEAFDKATNIDEELQNISLDDFSDLIDEVAAEVRAEQSPPVDEKARRAAQFKKVRRDHITRKLAEAKEPRERERLKKALQKLNAGKTATAEPVSGEKPEKDNGVESYFKKGQRVQLSDGTHGRVSEVTSYVMRSALLDITRHGGVGVTESREEHNHMYSVRLDNGVVTRTWYGDMFPETDPAPEVVAAPVYKGDAVDPGALLRGVHDDRNTARGKRAAASRAKKRENIAEHNRTADIYEKQATEKQAAFDTWAEQYPEEAAKYRPKVEEKPAAPSTVSGADARMSLKETVHSKKGHKLFVVVMNERVEPAVYHRMNSDAKRTGNGYSSYRGHGAIPGFQFLEKGAAEEFMQRWEKELAPAPAPTPTGVTDRENAERAKNLLQGGRGGRLESDREKIQRDLEKTGTARLDGVDVKIVADVKAGNGYQVEVVRNGHRTRDDKILRDLAEARDHAANILYGQAAEQSEDLRFEIGDHVEPVRDKDILKPGTVQHITRDQYGKERIKVSNNGNAHWELADFKKVEASLPEKQNQARSAANILKEAAIQGKEGMGEIVTGLYELFGGASLKSFPGGFDETTYAKAKPHFQAALEKFRAAGEGVREFLRFLLEQFDPSIKPYLMRFVAELKGDTFEAVKPALTGETSSDNLANEDKTINEEGAARDDTRNGGNGPRSLEGVSSGNVPEDEAAQRPGEGVGGRGKADAARDGHIDEGRGDGSGSMGSGSVPVHLQRPGEGLQPGLEDVPTPASEPRTLKLTGENPGNYRITESDRIGEGTRGERIDNNLAAIRIVKQLQEEGRHATREEQSALARYVGWGGLKSVFDPTSSKPQDQKARAELERLLTKEEYFEARQSVLNAHYTSREVIGAIYDIARHFGFKGGNVLEPTYGVGNFIGLMPADMAASSKWYGAELDPITAAIGQHLYPDSQLLNTGFQKAEFPYNKFDLAIGNPPFGDERITDTNKRRADIDGMKIHNYVIAKAGMHLKPGKLMAMVVTSRFLDTANPEARSHLAKDFAFLGAVRLPNNAFAKSAGTEVVTDLVFFRKLMPDEKPDLSADWLTTGATMTNEDGEVVRLNRYFAERPGLMLGIPSMQGTMYGGGRGDEFTLSAREGQDTLALFQAILAGELAPLKDVLKERTGDQADAAAVSLEMNREDVGVGGYVIEGDDIFMRGDDDADGNPAFVKLTPDTQWTEKTKLGKTRLDRILGMLKLREETYKLIEMERFDRPGIEAQRNVLNRLYDAFVKEHGFINDSANAGLMADDVKIEFGLEVNYRKPISAARAKALGVTAQRAKADKAALLKERVFYPQKEITTAANARDGYGISLSEKGRLDLDYIAQLTGKGKQDVVSDLAEEGLIFQDPETGEWVQEDEYLSGNVKAKLKDVRHRDGFERNVKALEKVLPRDVTTEEIFADLGSTWIPAKVYEEFADVMGIRKAKVHVSDATGTVTIVDHGNISQNDMNVMLKNDDYTVAELFNFIANKRAVVAYDHDSEGKRYVNKERTKLLVPIVKRFAATFRDWVMADPMRAKELTKLYNDTQNTHAERSFDGKHLKTVGANPAIVMRNTQRNAAWRMIQAPVTLLDHVVGAGKTFTIITGVMERRRLGLSRKPMVVVPNHLVGQWAKDFLRLYPGANILAATEKDFSKQNRRRLFSRIATGNFDAIIVGHSSFGFIPMERETEIAFVQEEMEYLERALMDAQIAEDKRTVRTLTNRIAKKRERIARLQHRERDNVATFESMGVDHLTVDESHEFKNLEYSTAMQNVTGMGTPTGAKKSFDLYAKIRYLRSKDGAVTFATGTPISNSLVEMYTLLRYLNLEGLKARRLDAFDAWAKAYAGIETRIEYTATQKLKERGVMAEFNNLPELLQLYTEFADVVSMGDLKRIYAEQIRERNKATGGNEREEFPVPKVKDGGRVLDVETPLESQRQYMDYLVARATRLERLGGQNDPRVDNHLWVMNDARKMALDIRLVDPSAASDSNNKIGRAARNIKRIYDQWNADKGTQLVFCDLSTPAKQSDKAAKKFINDALKIMALEKDVPVQTVLVSLMSWRDRWAYLRNRMEAKIEELDHALQTNTNLSDADEKSLNTWMNDLEKYLDEVTDEDEAALTTADTGFSVYDDLKAQLVEMGIPESEVRFIHEANTKDQKEELFAMVNAGEVRVLIGSSKKMGAGTNVQERIVAEHHLDAPWRPSDVEQREGRAVRQGNTLYERDPEGFELELIAYSTANTFDAVMWQVLARKAEMLEQFRSGVRSVQEGQSDADSYASFMAESTGNPAFKEKFRLEGEIAELEGTQRNIQARRSAAERLVAQKEDLTVKAQNNIDRAEADVTAVADASGFDYDGVHFNEDLDEVEAKAKAEYKAAWTEYETALNEYNNRRHDHWLTVNNQVGNGLDEEAAKQRIAKWDEEHKDEKPAAPKEVSLAGLARMSEAAKLGRIIEKQLDEMEDGEIVVKYGGVEVAFSVSEARFGNSGLKKGERKTYDYSVSVGNYFGSYQAKHPSAREIMSVFRDGAIKRQLARELESVKLQAGHTAKSIAEADLILDKVKFEDAGKLEEKRKRYAEVVEEVNRLESEIEERRESESNPYIDRDRRRFGDYDRRSPERQARQETDENEPVRFALRSDMNNDEALPALVETGLREFEPEMKYPEFAQKMKAALGEMWERFKGLMLKVWQQVRAKFLEERGSFNYREMKVPATERLFERVGVPAGNIFADYVKLQEKHPEYFATAEDVRRHVEFVLENPSDILPATKEGYTLLVRSDGKDRAAVVEFVKRGGKYRVRSAYILEEGQLEIKKQKALHAVSKPIPPENLGENIAEGGGVPSGTLRAEPFSEYRISPTDDEVKYALSAPSGLPASNIKAAFGPIYENLKNAPPWRVVQTAAELPERALKDAERRGIPQRLLQAVYLGNEVVYVADHFNSIEQAKQVILEEVVVHHGLRSILPQAAYEKHMLQAALWYANKRTDEWKALGKTYGLDLKSRSGRIEAAEEMLGRDARTGTDSTLMTRIIAAVKEFLRSIGFDMGYGEAEIRELLGKARRFVEGKESPAPSPQPRTNGIDYGALLRTLRERGITDEQLQAFAAFEPGGARFAFSPSQYQAFDEDTVTGYEGVPDNLMGFGKQPKGFTETKYPYELEVYYSYDKGVTWHDDAIKGMNPLHALERARRNWPDAQIRTLPVDSKFALARLQDVKGQIVDKGVSLNTTEREVLEADREKAVEAIGETVKDYDEPGRFLFRAFYESDQDKAPGVVPYNPERGHYAAGENLKGSWWTTSLATAQEIAWSKARDGRPVKIVALPLDRLPNGNIYIQNTNPPGMVYDLFVGLPADVPMSAVREMPVDSGIRYALAEPFTAISEQFRSKDVLRNMAKLLNPLDWSRLKRWIEDVTPQNMRNGAATFLRNPVFEADTDDNKKPFVETGVKREETKLDYLLRFLGWDGPAAKAPNVMERLKKTYTQWESADRTTEWGRITDAFQKLTVADRKGVDLLLYRGDVLGKVFKTFEMVQADSKTAKVSEAAFEVYQRVRTHIDTVVADAIEQLSRQFMYDAGLPEDVIEKHLADYRNRREERPGWLPRNHGDGDYQVNVYHVITGLKWEMRGDKDTMQALLPYFPSKEVADEIKKICDMFGLKYRQLRNGQQLISTDKNASRRFRKEIEKLKERIAVAKGDEKAELETKLANVERTSVFAESMPAEQIRRFKEKAGEILPKLNTRNELAIRERKEALQQAIEDGESLTTINMLKDELKKYGDGRIKVKVYMRLQQTKTRAERHKAEVEKDLKKAMPYNFREGEQYETGYHFANTLSESMYGDMKNDFAVEQAQLEAINRAAARQEITKEEASELRNKILQSTAEVLMARGAGRHQIRRAEYLIEGYDTEGTVDAYHDYMTGTAGMLSKARYAYDQFEHFRYAPAEVKRWAEKYIKDNLRNMGFADMVSGNLRALASFAYLGFKVSSMVINATQPWTLGIAELGRHTKRSAVWAIGKAQKDIVRGKLSESEKRLFASEIFRVQEQETAVHEMSGSREGATGKFSRFMHTLTDKTLAPFQEVELLNRKTVILAAYRTFRADGLGRDEALAKALEVNRAVNFEMSRANLPGFAQKPLGRTVYALQSFLWNNWNWVFNRLASGKKEDMIALLRYAAAMAIIGGAAAMPGGDELDKLYQMLFGESPKLAFQKWTKKHAREYGSLGEMVHGFAWHGLASATGVNISNAMRLQIPIVSPILSGDSLPEAAGGVFTGLAQKGARAVRAASRGDMYRMIENISPEALAGGMRAYRMATKGATTGTGKVIFDEQGRPMKYGTGEAVTRALGFQPSRVAERNDLTNVEKGLSAHWKEERGDLLAELRLAKPGERKEVMLKIMRFNRRLRDSQAAGLVPVIKAETIRRTLTENPNKRKSEWQQNQLS